MGKSHPVKVLRKSFLTVINDGKNLHPLDAHGRWISPKHVTVEKNRDRSREKHPLFDRSEQQKTHDTQRNTT